MKTIEPAEAAKLVKEGFLATHAQRLEMQKKRLAELVGYARENSPYLKKTIQGTPGSPLYMARDRHRNLIHGQLLAQRLLNGIDPGFMDHTKHRLAMRT